MPRSLPDYSSRVPERGSLVDLSTNDVSGLAQTAQFERAAPGPLPTIDARSRYQILERLGAGGFGVVFKAWDAELERTVAIKLLRPGADGSSTAHLLAEARTLARLDHPAIVPVYDLGRTTNDDLLIVSKFVEGRDLSKWLKTQRMSPVQAATCVAILADALDYAHAQGIVHRDVKPGNILLTATGEPVLSDFGLALHDAAVGSGSNFVGTPAYMSPEQARYEGHRVDGRSDIYSLGTVFYELLTGSRPFQARNREELLDYVRNVEARPPRQIDRTLPRELERICLKSLAKRAADRYPTAGDMASDLRDWVGAQGATPVPDAKPVPTAERAEETSHSARAAPAVVPHGLRSFDESDADFFLYLLPGARDRDGVPESVRFWKRRIESADPADAFRVGVLLGPSGSGKSSLLRAGVVPLLGDQIQAIVVDAGPADFEDRLRRRLAREIADGDDALSLHDLAVRVRQQGPGAGKTKLLIVIDQFEQWLNVHDGETHTALGETLRQCDGVTLQALLLVRDDFTLAITRFLEELEEPLLQNRNFAAIDRFSPEHAAKVLEAFGRAYRVWEGEPSRENRRFIDRAIAELAQGGRMVPVQIAALAEIVKERPWTDATLRQLGGVQGVDVEFLEQRLVGERSHPEIRLHLTVVRRLLQALLPADGENIRGRAKTRSELLAALGEAITPQRLDKLLLLLDVDVRLITPVRSPTADSTSSDSSQREPAYQLTHDYLVSAIRAWLTANERGTRFGRARLRLRELAAAWSARPSPQRLPTFLEWLTIRSLTPRGEWSLSERRMMQTAARRILRRSAIVVGSALLIAAGIWQATRYQRAEALYARLLAADTSEVPAIVAELNPYRSWTTRRLHRDDPPAAGAPDALALRRQLHKKMALAAAEPEAARFVVEHLEQIEPENLNAVRSLLAPQREVMMPLLWKQLGEPASDRPPDAVLAAACVLAAFDNQHVAWREAAPRLARLLIASRPAALPHWLHLLRGHRSLLVSELLKLLQPRAATLTAGERSQLFESLSVLAVGDPDSLVAGLERAEAADMLALWPSVARRADGVRTSLRKRLAHWTGEIGGAGAGATDLPSDLNGSLQAWSGASGRHWAYAAACPRDEFDALAARLKSAGYAPLTLRPYAAPSQSLLAAAFDRSQRNCRWQFDVPAGEAASTIESARAEGWALCDLAPYAAGQPPVERFALLWERLSSDEADSRFLIEAHLTQFNAMKKQWEPRGYVLERCSSRVDPAGRIAYCALWRKRAVGDVGSTHSTRYASAFGELYPGSSLSDVRLHIIEPGQRDSYSPAAWFEDEEHDLESALTTTARQRALGNMARYALVKGDAAAASALCGQLQPTAVNILRRGTAAARLADAAELKASVVELEKAAPGAPAALQLRVRLAALERQAEELPRLLAAFGKPANADNRVREVHALALAASMAATAETLRPQASSWRLEALQKLDRLLAEGAAPMPEMAVFDPDCDSLRADPAFHELLRSQGLNRRYESVGPERKDLECRLIYDVGVFEHQRRAQELSAQRYRLICLEARLDPTTEQLVVVSAWGRAVPPAEDSIQAARCIARLAACDFRLGRTELLADVLRDRHGREARAQLIEIATAWLPVPRLLDLLRGADSAALQRSVLLALGSAAERDRPIAARDELQAQVRRLAADATDAAVSAAAAWCAKQWNLTIDSPSSSAKIDARNWYVNSLGQTMIVLDPPGQYLMGSPEWELDRVENEGDEQRHWQRIGRRFSIAATETTVAAFREFLDDPRVKKAYAGRPFLRAERYAPTPDCPITSVRWFDAARFCQWLSEREGLAETDGCYPGIWELSLDKWQCPADMLSRRGYRLPTEAEWEYACRGGADSSRPYGDDRQLLARYAWHLNTADERSHSVASLLPNDFGLFDTLGNVLEWCQDPYGKYKTPVAGYLFVDELADPPASIMTQQRVLRGGSFEMLPRQVRSADRTVGLPTANGYQYGFRVARTEAAASK